AQSGSIEGRVEAAKPRVRRVADRYAAGGGAVAKIQPLPAVVVLEGAEGAGAGTRRHRLAQRDTAFVPGVLVVPPGATVEFPNEDPFFHNVFSYSSVNRFDLGRYPRGESKSVRFDRPGVVRIYCEVHESMRAVVIVTPSAHHAGEEWAILADPLEDGRAGDGWRLLAVPLEPVLAPFRRILRALVVAGAAALWLALGVGSLLARGLGAAVIAPAAGRRPSSAAIPSGRNASPAPVTRHRAARGSAGCSTVALGRKSTGSSMTAPAWAVAQKRRSVPPIETTPSASSHSEIAHRNAAYQRTARLPGFSRSTSPVARRL